MEVADEPDFWGAGGFFVDHLVAAYEADGAVYADKNLVVTLTHDPPGLRFAGEIDIANSTSVGKALQLTFPKTGDPHLDVSRLIFCDISGIRALVDSAHSLGDGRRLKLHGLPPQLQRVLDVTGWSGHPGLVLCDCDAGDR